MYKRASLMHSRTMCGPNSFLFKASGICMKNLFPSVFFPFSLLLLLFGFIADAPPLFIESSLTGAGPVKQKTVDTMLHSPDVGVKPQKIEESS